MLVNPFVQMRLKSSKAVSYTHLLQGVKALVGGFADLIGYVAPAGDGILGFTASVGDFIVGIDEAIKSSDAFNKAIEGIGNFLKPIADGIKTCLLYTSNRNSIRVIQRGKGKASSGAK